MNKNMYYEENRNLEEEDIGYDSPIYTATIYDKQFLITIGKERKLVTKKNHYYFPVYLMNKNVVQLQVGAFEYTSNNEKKDDRIKPYLDSFGDLDLNRLGDIIFYSFADYDYFQNITINVTSVIISEMETKYAKMLSDTVHEDVNANADEDNVFELGETDIKMSKSMKQTETVLKEGVFEIDRGIKKPAHLEEETKEKSFALKKEYTERKNQTWIETYMKNNNYDIVETNNNGDCLFDTIRLAYEQIGYKTTIQKLRSLVAKEATEEMFTEYRELYQGALGEKSEIEKEMRRLMTVNKELKKRLKTLTSNSQEKEQRTNIIKDANEVSMKYKDLKEKLDDNSKLLSEFAFMKNVSTLENLREYILQPVFWADNWAISVLEKELNMKLIIFSESIYNDDDKNNVLQCNISGVSNNTNFSPDFYIFTTYSGLHYRLITYKNKRIFKFDEIPYDVKIMVVIKCMERNSGVFNKISDFRHFKSKIGVADDVDGDGDDGDGDGDNVMNNTREFSVDEDTVFAFYNKSSGTPKPGKGSNEKISQNKVREYSDLGLKKHFDWRKKLDDDWSTNFTVDNMKWKTVEHYYQGSKFKKHNPHFYKLFSLDSDNEISKDVEIAKHAGSLKGSYKKRKTVVQIRPLEIKIDPDFMVIEKMKNEKKRYMQSSHKMMI